MRKSKYKTGLRDFLVRAWRKESDQTRIPYVHHQVIKHVLSLCIQVCRVWNATKAATATRPAKVYATMESSKHVSIFEITIKHITVPLKDAATLAVSEFCPLAPSPEPLEPVPTPAGYPEPVCAADEVVEEPVDDDEDAEVALELMEELELSPVPLSLEPSPEPEDPVPTPAGYPEPSADAAEEVDEAVDDACRACSGSAVICTPGVRRVHQE